MMREPANPQQVAAKLAAVPHSPGVYLFRDAGANVIYVGKSLDLRQRVHAYFSKSGDERFKIVYLVAETADLEWIVTDTELEALFLENTLIKRHRPRYNVKLRDDKTYPYLRIDLRDEFPRLEMVRRYKRDGARYFGPYLSARHVTTVLRAIHRHFHIRQCEGKLDGAAPRPCMFCQIEWCRGPCAGRIARDDYGKFVRETLLLLEGKVDELTAALQQRMEEAAERLEFEVAAKLRDQIQAVQRISERQKVIDPKAEDEDIIALLDQGDMALAVVFHIRDGRLIGRSRISVPLPLEQTSAALLAEFIVRYYGSGHLLPSELVLGETPERPELLAAWLREKRRSAVRLTIPQRGRKRRLLEMAIRDGLTHLAYQRSSASPEAGLKELQRVLNLPRPPRRIEAVDISNISGVFAVGSLAVFRDGKPDRAAYRRYKIQLTGQIDDYAMIGEVLRRRAARRDQRGWELPDLLVIDGGKGHLNMALKVMGTLQNDHFHLASIAKVRGARLREGIFVPHLDDPLELEPDAPALRVLTRIRDEAHRLAITYHRLLRGKALRLSLLDEIPGVGPKRRAALLRSLGSLTAVKLATVEQLAAVPGIDKTTAANIRQFLDAIDTSRKDEEPAKPASAGQQPRRTVKLKRQDKQQPG